MLQKANGVGVGVGVGGGILTPRSYQGAQHHWLKSVWGEGAMDFLIFYYAADITDSQHVYMLQSPRQMKIRDDLAKFVGMN